MFNQQYTPTQKYATQIQTLSEWNGNQKQKQNSDTCTILYGSTSAPALKKFAADKSSSAKDRNMIC